MSSCKIKSIARITFQSMKNLLILDISYNDITHLPAETFADLTFLRQLILTGNYDLNTIEPDAFAGLVNVRLLTITHTKLNKLSRRTFVGLNLTDLDLSNNRLRIVEDFAFQDMNVVSIYLQENSLTTFDKDMFTGVRSLKSLVTSAYKFCCIKPSSVNEEDCLPHTDAFSSCADLMRSTALRSILWVIGLSALLGNIMSLAYRMKYERHKLKLGYGIFVSNLEVADFLMGVYLIIIATADQVYRDRYTLMDEIWRTSVWCDVAGILATVSTEASVLFICFVTLDRFIVIKFPFGRIRFNTKSALIVAASCWILALVIALVPILDTGYFNQRFYSKSGVCLALPLSFDRPLGWEYSIAVFIGFNFITFVLIAIGQSLIYMEVRKMSNQVKGAHFPRRNDLIVARNLLLVVATNFLCWFPICCMGMMSLRGHVIYGDVYAWAAVLILPINSAFNPFLYTLSACFGERNPKKIKTPGKPYVKNRKKTTQLSTKL